MTRSLSSAGFLFERSFEPSPLLSAGCFCFLFSSHVDLCCLFCLHVSSLYPFMQQSLASIGYKMASDYYSAEEMAVWSSRYLHKYTVCTRTLWKLTCTALQFVNCLHCTLKAKFKKRKVKTRKEALRKVESSRMRSTHFMIYTHFMI